MRRINPLRPRVVDAPFRFETIKPQGRGFQFPEPTNKVHEWNKRYCPYLKEGSYTCAQCRLERHWLWDKCHRMRIWGIDKDEGKQ